MRLSLALAAVLLAGGCINAGEPSEDDIRGALTQAGNRGGPKAVKLACKRGTDRPGFVCDYRAPACNRFTNGCGSPKPGSGRFVKSGGRWQLVEDMTSRPTAAPGTNPLPKADIPAPTIAPTVTAPVPTSSPVPTEPTRPLPTEDFCPLVLSRQNGALPWMVVRYSLRRSCAGQPAARWINERLSQNTRSWGCHWWR